MIYIFIDLILHPDIGPGDKGGKRYKYAIDICRTYASLPKMDVFPIGKIMTVFIAGIALGGKRISPEEVEWLYDWVLGDLHHYFPLNRQAAVLPFTAPSTFLLPFCSHVYSRTYYPMPPSCPDFGIWLIVVGVYEGLGDRGEFLGCHGSFE